MTFGPDGPTTKTENRKDKKMPKNEETNERRRVVRRRNLNTGSETRPYCMRIRATREVSARLASIQGLCWRYGARETLADLFEDVCMPALADYVAKYADAAKTAREAAKGGAE